MINGAINLIINCKPRFGLIAHTFIYFRPFGLLTFPLGRRLPLPLLHRPLDRPFLVLSLLLLRVGKDVLRLVDLGVIFRFYYGDS